MIFEWIWQWYSILMKILHFASLKMLDQHKLAASSSYSQKYLNSGLQKVHKSLTLTLLPPTCAWPSRTLNNFAAETSVRGSAWSAAADSLQQTEREGSRNRERDGRAQHGGVNKNKQRHQEPLKQCARATWCSPPYGEDSSWCVC